MLQPEFFKFTNTNLIWYRHIGAGTKYFLKEFNKFDLKQIDLREVNWSNDLVFGHIIDPLERRHHGIASWLMERKFDVDFFSKDQHYSILESMYFDEHSEPISIILKDKCNLVNWIPLDFFGIDPYVITKEILSSYNISITFPQPYFKQDELKLKFYNIIKIHYLESSKFSDTIRRVFEKDLELYKQAIHKYST